MNTLTFTVTAEGTAGHTQRDYDEMVAAGIDPADRQHRDHPTVCGCGRQTWHLSATCDAHYEAPAVRR